MDIINLIMDIIKLFLNAVFNLILNSFLTVVLFLITLVLSIIFQISTAEAIKKIPAKLRPQFDGINYGWKNIDKKLDNIVAMEDERKLIEILNERKVK